MSNLREVNDDILKDLLLFREYELSSLSYPENKKHWVYFDEISKKILNIIPGIMFKNNLIFLMITLCIILVIGMRSIIGMAFVIMCTGCWVF